MDALNYHHLLYFWVVAREGSIVRASEKLRLAQPTVSGQIRQLERELGIKLFRRIGRGLTLTDAGKTVYRYAEEIFSLGRELLATARGGSSSRPLRLAVGIVDVVPKLIAYRLIEPALHLAEPVEIVCVEDKQDRLVAELAVNGLDLVLSDAPFSRRVRVHAYNHLLGECPVTVLGAPKLASQYSKGFPQSLDGAPFVLPCDKTALRPALDRWFDSLRIRPHVRAVMDDSGLLNAFGQAGVGLFCTPSAIEEEVKRQYRVRLVGRVEKLKERYFAISVDRQLKHPAVLAISQAPRRDVFAGKAPRVNARRTRAHPSSASE